MTARHNGLYISKLHRVELIDSNSNFIWLLFLNSFKGYEQNASKPK